MIPTEAQHAQLLDAMLWMFEEQHPPLERAIERLEELWDRAHAALADLTPAEVYVLVSKIRDTVGAEILRLKHPGKDDQEEG
jgi:hypothetical protein